MIEYGHNSGHIWPYMAIYIWHYMAMSYYQVLSIAINCYQGLFQQVLTTAVPCPPAAQQSFLQGTFDPGRCPGIHCNLKVNEESARSVSMCWRLS